MTTRHRRTRSVESTATEFARGCAGNSGTHDAGLCDRIRALEAEVERLKAQPSHCHHWHWNSTPYYPYYPTWTANTTKTYGTTNTTSTVRLNG